MNTTKKISSKIILGLGVSLALASTAFAATMTGSVTTSTTTPKMTVAQTKRLAEIIAKGDKEIAARIADLDKLSARVDGIKNVSDLEKATLAANVQTQTDGLSALKTQLDADTDLTIAQKDEKSILTNFRIYALVAPQSMILASADRVITIVSLMTTIGTKLQARIAVGTAAGKNVTALQTALTDFNTKVTDAATQAQTAGIAVVSLAPDQGNTTTAAANKTALQGARADLKVATSDLKAARADVDTILKGLKALKLPAPSATATSTTTSSTTTATTTAQ